MKLHDMAHARAGDKGDTSDVTVFAYESRDYPLLVVELTVGRVRALFNGLVRGEIERHLLPQLGAIKFVMRGALGGGVTRSLALDAHGKCYSSILLDMEISRQSHEARSDDEALSIHQTPTPNS
jgi:hypothetical protein